jgi:glycosyltransferase involved in cell wall biosynthesis
MKILPPKVKKLFEIWKSGGFAGISNRLKEIARRKRELRDYSRWIEAHKITEKTRENIRNKIADFAQKPLISIILPVYNTDEKWLRLCIESVIKQLYENWELCIADDKSPGPHVRQILEEYAARDTRIKLVFRSENGHISAASNSALELATGEFCVLLDHDDELTEDALFYVAGELNEFPETAFVYSDEDMIDERGRRFYPKFKPDFSRDFFYSLNLITHLSAYKTSILRAIGGFRIGLEGSQDYDLALRFIEQIDERQIRHIPRILYHWRAIEGSVALSSDEKPYAHERARQALREHFQRTGKAASVERGLSQFHRVRYDLPADLPRVSLILSANETGETSEKAAARFLSETDYQNLEIISTKPENLSKAESFNQAVSASSGEILCFVDSRLSPLSKDWLQELISFAIQKEIGAVGGKILASGETILSCGFVIGFDGLAGAAFESLPTDTDRNLFRARVVNNFSAVSVNCMAVRRENFEKTGGFDAENLPDSLFDADFCLRLGEQNLRTIFTPYAEFVQTEKFDLSVKPSAKESEFFRSKWQNVIEQDPFYNPNLSLCGETFTIKL